MTCARWQLESNGCLHLECETIHIFQLRAILAVASGGCVARNMKAWRSAFITRSEVSADDIISDRCESANVMGDAKFVLAHWAEWWLATETTLFLWLQDFSGNHVTCLQAYAIWRMCQFGVNCIKIKMPAVLAAEMIISWIQNYYRLIFNIKNQRKSLFSAEPWPWANFGQQGLNCNHLKRSFTLKWSVGSKLSMWRGQIISLIQIVDFKRQKNWDAKCRDFGVLGKSQKYFVSMDEMWVFCVTAQRLSGQFAKGFFVWTECGKSRDLNAWLQFSAESGMWAVRCVWEMKEDLIVQRISLKCAVALSIVGVLEHLKADVCLWEKRE